MSDLTDLYQELILDHNRRPRNCGSLETPQCEAHGHNPLCGDQIHIAIEMDGDVIRDIRFEGSGCAISTASASLMTESVKGKSRAEAERLHDGFHHLITGSGEPSDVALGKLQAFANVGRYPARVKCATLAWHTLRAALGETETVVSTE